MIRLLNAINARPTEIHMRDVEGYGRGTATEGMKGNRVGDSKEAGLTCTQKQKLNI
jgi:hypothetical protein